METGGDGSGTDVAGLGGAIRSARGERGIREVAAAAAISKSALARYERGERSPSLDVIAILDTVLGMGGLLVGRYESASWVPTGDPAVVHQHLFDHDWQGPVFIEVRPGTPGPHQMHVRWGPWRRTFAHEVSSAGVAFVTMKSRPADGHVPPLTFFVDPPGFVRFGRGEPMWVADVVDISSGWVPSEASDVLRTAGSLIAGLAQAAGRSDAEVAEFFSMTIPEVRALWRGRPP